MKGNGTSDIRVKEDFSSRVRFLRRHLGLVMTKLVSAKKRAKISFDKLVYNGKFYRYDDKSGFLKCDADLKLYDYNDRLKDLELVVDSAVTDSDSDISGVSKFRSRSSIKKPGAMTRTASLDTATGGMSSEGIEA